MSIEIKTIVHPYFMGKNLEANTFFYDNLINSVLNTPDTFLYYVAAVSGLLVKQRSSNHLFESDEERELQRKLKGLSTTERQRIAILADSKGEYQLLTPSFNVPCSIEELVSKYESPLKWFSERDIRTYYNSQLNTAYLETTGMNLDLWKQLTVGDQYSEDGRTYVTSPLSPQITKLVRFLGPTYSNVLIEGKSSLVIPTSVRKQVGILGSGELIERCVFVQSLKLALALGIPLSNVALNSNQPYILVEGEENLSYYESPIQRAFYLN